MNEIKSALKIALWAIDEMINQNSSHSSGPEGQSESDSAMLEALDEAYMEIENLKEHGGYILSEAEENFEADPS